MYNVNDSVTSLARFNGDSFHILTICSVCILMFLMLIMANLKTTYNNIH